MEGTEGSIRSSQVRRTVRRGTSIPNPCRSPSRARAAGTTGDPIRPGGRVQGPSRRRLCRSSERARPHPAPRPWRAPHLNKLDHRRRRQPTPDCPLRPPQSGGHLSASDTAAAPCKGQTSATASCGGSGGGGVDSSVRRGDSDRASAQGRSASFCARPPRGRRSQLTHAARMSRPGYRWSQFKKQARQRRLAVCIERHEHAALIARSCVYCGAQPSSTLRISVDRTDSARPYEPQNCVPSCSRCNYMKNTMSLHTFLRQAHRIAQRHPVAGGVHESPVLPDTDA